MLNIKLFLKYSPLKDFLYFQLVALTHSLIDLCASQVGPIHLVLVKSLPAYDLTLELEPPLHIKKLASQLSVELNF